MILLKVAKNGGFELTDKNHIVTVNDKQIQLGSTPISAPGEYEANGIEVVYAEHGALLVWERLQILYLFTLDSPTAFEQAQFNSSNVLLLSQQLLNASKSQLNEQIAAYDPSVIILSESSAADETKEAFKFETTNSIKLQMTALPEEGRTFYLLQ